MPPVDCNNPQRCASSESRYSVMEFLSDFPDDAACLEWLWPTRYSSNGVHAVCPRCEVERPFKRHSTHQRRQSWTCTACSLNVHPTSGTVFHKSSTSLRLWFHAMYLMTSTRCGTSAKQLERELGVTYKTAWRMFHLIRNELMAQDDDQLSGHVEMAETFVGGKPCAKDRAAWAHAADKRQAGKQLADKKKVPVFGMVQRGGNVAAFVIPSKLAATLGRHVEAPVLLSSTVYTDEEPAFIGITRDGGYGHRRIHHQARVYAQGDVHTNTIEGFWSLVKRGIGGRHHAVSAKFLQGYLNEYVWRNKRRSDSRVQSWALAVRSALTVID